MSIRPIDYTLSVQRSGDLLRSENGLVRPETAQQQFAAELQRQVLHDAQTVVDRYKAEAADVEKDGKGYGGGGSSGRKKKDKKEPEKKQPAQSGSMIDISV